MLTDKPLQTEENCLRNRKFLFHHIRIYDSRDGFTLLEVIVAIAIFAVIVAAIYTAFIAQMKHATREYKISESEMELGIAKNIIERDLAVAGYGLADDYSGLATVPRVASITASPYTLTLTGTALGIKSRASQAWSYITGISGSIPSFQTWGDARENLKTNDYVILMEPSSKTLLGESGTWKFRYAGSSSNLTPNPTTLTVGTLVYGLSDSIDPAQPYYAVAYSLGGTPPTACASGTQNLLRAESLTSTAPTGGDRILACVRDFQVSFGLDTDNNGSIDRWDSDGSQSDTSQFTTQELKKAIKQIKMYVLVQTSNSESGYTYPNATVRVGDTALGTGHTITLTSEQRRCRWKLVSLTITPRNIR